MRTALCFSLLLSPGLSLPCPAQGQPAPATDAPARLTVQATWTARGRGDKSTLVVETPKDKPLPPRFPDHAVLVIDLTWGDDPLEQPAFTRRVESSNRKFREEISEADENVEILPGEYHVKVRLDDTQTPQLRRAAAPFRGLSGETRVTVGSKNQICEAINKIVEGVLEDARAIRRDYPQLASFFVRARNKKADESEWRQFKAAAPLYKANERLLRTLTATGFHKFLPRANGMTHQFQLHIHAVTQDVDYLLGPQEDKERNAAVQVAAEKISEKPDAPVMPFNSLVDTLFLEGRSAYAAGAEKVFLAADQAYTTLRDRNQGAAGWTAADAAWRKTLDEFNASFEKFAAIEWPLDGATRAKLSFEFKETVNTLRQYLDECGKVLSAEVAEPQSKVGSLRGALVTQFNGLRRVLP